MSKQRGSSSYEEFGHEEEDKLPPPEYDDVDGRDEAMEAMQQESETAMEVLRNENEHLKLCVERMEKEHEFKKEQREEVLKKENAALQVSLQRNEEYIKKENMRLQEENDDIRRKNEELRSSIQDYRTESAGHRTSDRFYAILAEAARLKKRRPDYGNWPMYITY
jgi:hypothetical protein